MPELPEVETMVRGIRPFVEGRQIVEFRRCDCRYRPISLRPGIGPMRRRAASQKIVAVRRRAKRVVLELESGDAFVIEPRMTGLMLLSDPPDREHLRVAWRFSAQGSHDTLWFWDRRGLGTVRLLSRRECEDLFTPGLLGRDALEMTPADWLDFRQATARAVKVALLDQTLVAGIGNLYASEILHLAKIHPERPTKKMTRPQVERLAAATASVLEAAIRFEGSTLSDGTYRNALNQAGSYQNAHCVYDRAGQPCPTCGHGPIRRIVQAQRSTFYCPRCQR